MHVKQAPSNHPSYSLAP